MRKFLNKYWGWTFLIVPIILQAVFFYFPMVQGAFYSLTNWTGLTYNYKFVGLNNYKLLLIDGKFFQAIIFTIVLTLALIIGEIFIGMVVARALNSKIKGQTFFRAWFFFPAVLSGLTVSLIFKQFFNYGLPTIGKVLGIGFLQEACSELALEAVIATIFVLLWQGWQCQSSYFLRVFKVSQMIFLKLQLLTGLLLNKHSGRLSYHTYFLQFQWSSS